MLVGYARVSKSEGNLDLQKDNLISAGVSSDKIYEEYASGKSEDRPELKQCLKSNEKASRDQYKKQCTRWAEAV